MDNLKIFGENRIELEAKIQELLAKIREDAGKKEGLTDAEIEAL